NDIDAKVFHRGIDELFHYPWHAMDLIDEQNRPLRRVGQERQHVGRLAQRGAAGHLYRRAKLVGKDGGEGGFAQTWRPIEQYMRHRLVQLLAGAQYDFQALLHRFLADDFAQEPWPQGSVALLVVILGWFAWYDGLSGHGWISFRRGAAGYVASRSAAVSHFC